LAENGVRRLNWGCGTDPEPGWINSDVKDAPGIDVPCDIRSGLPLPTGCIEYAVSIHALPELAYPDVVPALAELRRVLRPTGVLRLGLPDLERAVTAFWRGDRNYFLVPDEDAASLGAKLVVQLVWYGYTRTPFTHEFIEEQLLRAGFGGVRRCAFRETASPYPEIVALDNREHESLFVEAVP
jgi:hypothetical protein